MNFADTEVELAKQLKDAGLNRKLQKYDFVLYDYSYHGVVELEQNMVAVTLPRDQQNRIVLLERNHGMVSRDDCIWLPTLQQGIDELIRAHGAMPQLLTHDTYYSVNDGWLEGKSVTGETPIEAVYKLLLEVLNERKD